MIRFDPAVSGSQIIDFGNFIMPPGLNGFTVCAFVSYAQGMGEQDNRIIGQDDNGADQVFSLYAQDAPNDGSKKAIEFRFRTGAGVGSQTTVASPKLSPDQIYHVAGVYDGSTQKIYIDGIEVASTPKTGNVTVQNSWNLVVGNRPDFNRSFEGLIGDCRVYDRALSEDELASILETNGQIQLDDGLLFHAPLDGPDGATVTGAESVLDVLGGENTAQKGGTPNGNPVYEDALRQSETPRNMNNIFAWFDGSEERSMDFNNANTVNSWEDKNGDTSKVFTSGNSPEINEVFINGLNTIFFDPNEHLNGNFLDGATGLVGKKYAIFIVEQKANTNADQWIMGGSESINNQNLHIGYRSGNQFSFAQWGNDINVTNANYQPSGVTRLHTMINSSSGKSLKLNGSQLASNTNTDDLTDYDGAEIGRRQASTETYEGAICEIIIFDRELSTTEIEQVEKYLMNKWGI